MTTQLAGGRTLPAEPSLEQLRSGVVVDTKGQLEFSRYKQDCRKRALDFAMEEFRLKRRVVEPDALISEGGTIDEKTNVIELADKYYNWLISIPQ